MAGGRLRVEIRTVNHRYFNLAPKLPGDLSGLEGELRERLRREFDRGHVAVQVRWTEYPERAGGFAVDLDRARLVTSRLRELQSALGLAGDVTLELVARQPDVLSTDQRGGGRGAVGRGRADRGAGGGRVPRDAGARGRGAGGGAAPSAWSCWSRRRESSRGGRRSGWCASATGSAARWRSCSTGGRPTRPGWRRRSRSRPTGSTSPRSWCGSGRTSPRCARRSRPIGPRASSSASWRRSWGAR